MRSGRSPRSGLAKPAADPRRGGRSPAEAYGRLKGRSPCWRDAPPRKAGRDSPSRRGGRLKPPGRVDDPPGPPSKRRGPAVGRSGPRSGARSPCGLRKGRPAPAPKLRGGRSPSRGGRAGRSFPKCDERAPAAGRKRGRSAPSPERGGRSPMGLPGNGLSANDFCGRKLLPPGRGGRPLPKLGLYPAPRDAPPSGRAGRAGRSERSKRFGRSEPPGRASGRAGRSRLSAEAAKPGRARRSKLERGGRPLPAVPSGVPSVRRKLLRSGLPELRESLRCGRRKPPSRRGGRS